MVWQIPSCFTTCLVKYSRAGESRASSFLTTYVLLSGPLLGLLVRRHYYSCYQPFLSASFGPADGNREERTRDHYIVQSSSATTVPRRDQGGARQSPPLQQEHRAKRWEDGPQIHHVKDAQTSGIARHTTASPTISFFTFTSEEVTFPNVSPHTPFSLFSSLKWVGS